MNKIFKKINKEYLLFGIIFDKIIEGCAVSYENKDLKIYECADNFG